MEKGLVRVSETLEKIISVLQNEQNIIVTELTKKKIEEILIKDYEHIRISENILEIFKKNAGYSRWDINGRPVVWNQKMEEMTGYTLKDLQDYFDGHGEVQTLLYKIELNRLSAKEAINKLHAGESYSKIFYPNHKNGDQKAFLYYSGPAKDANGNIEGSDRFAFDITQNLIDQEQINLLNEIVENSISAVVAYDKDGKLIMWNKKMEEITGYSFEEVKDLTGDEIMRLLYKGEELERVQSYLKELEITGRGYENVAFTLTRKDGTKRIVLWNTVPGSNGGTRRSGQDITEQESAKWEVLRDTFGCFNRNGLLYGFTDIILEKSAKNAPNKRVGDIKGENELKEEPIISANIEHHSLVFGDFDDFKKVNDTFGHKVGDLLIGLFVKFLQKRLRQADIISRYGGDEFIIILRGSDQAGAIHKINEIREEFSRLSFRSEGGKLIIKEEKLHSNQDEAAIYIKEMNKKNGIDTLSGTAYFGAIGSSWGVGEIIYDKQNEKFNELGGFLKCEYSQDEENGTSYNDKYTEKRGLAKSMLEYKKNEADSILLKVKYLNLLKREDIPTKGKNGVGVLIKDQTGQVKGMKVTFFNFEVEISLDEMRLIEELKGKKKEMRDN